jgi:hypothetical protein
MEDGVDTLHSTDLITLVAEKPLPQRLLPGLLPYIYSQSISIVRTNRMHYLLSIYLTINLYMFRVGLLLIIRRYQSVYTVVGMYHAFMVAGC